MTNAELVVAIRVTAENVEETLESIKKSAEEMGATVERVGKDAGDAFAPMKTSAAEAAAAQAALAAAASAAFKTVVGAVQTGTEAYNKYTGAMKGLDSIATGRGIGEDEMTEALNGVTDAFFSAASAATAYKNLLSRGYTLDQATTTINRLKDAATFGRQANLSLEEAVVNATEGIRNENSILVDNAGVTKNVAKMWEDYAKARNLSVTSLTTAQKIEAEYLGILEETKFQVGDLEKASETLAGSQAEQAAQATKLATAYGDAMAPSVQAMTEAGTGFLKTATEIVQQFPAMTSGATGAATAFLALVAAMKGLEAVKGLLSAISIGSATLGPLAAVAAIVGLATTAYSAYAKAQDEAAQAEEEAAQKRAEAKEEEQKALKAVNDELRTLYTLYGTSEESMEGLAGAYDSGNDAIVDRIRLLEEEQTALLEKQKLETEIALEQADSQHKLDTDEYAHITQNHPWFNEDDFIAIDKFSGAQGMRDKLDEWIDEVYEKTPALAEAAEGYYEAIYNAETLEEAKEASSEYFDQLYSECEESAEEAAALREQLAGIEEAMADPEKFDFEKTFGEGEDAAEDAADGTEDLEKALKDAEKQVKDFTKDYQKLAKELEDNRAQKKQITALKDQAKEAKKTGKQWDDLSDELKAYAKQNKLTEGDIDGLINALGNMETSLDNSANAGIAEMQSLQAQLTAVRSAILSIPELVLSGDATPLITEIDAAIAEIERLLALMAEAGISPSDTKTRTGGGGGGGKKKDSGGGGKSMEEIWKEQYDEQIEALEHKRHMEQITAREEIEELERIKREYAKTAELVMDIDERIFDARKELREEEAEKITNYYDAIMEALEERYEEQREIEQKRIDESIEAWERWSDETTAAIQKQIEALDEQEEAQERAEEEAEHLRKIEKLEASLPYETDEYNQKQILRQIEEAKKELQALYDEWALEDQRQALEDQMDAIEKKAEEEIEKLGQESERIDTVYDKLTEGASLAAEAQKMLMDGNQKEILDLISNYAPDYEATGRSLGEKLFDGFKAAFGDITDYFKSIDAQFEAMVDRIQQTAFSSTQQIQQSGETAANVSSPVVNQTVNFNQPVESAVEVAERMQEVSEELAAMMM